MQCLSASKNIIPPCLWKCRLVFFLAVQCMSVVLVKFVAIRSFFPFFSSAPLKITARSFLLLVYQLQSFFISSFHLNFLFCFQFGPHSFDYFLDLLLNWFSFQFHLLIKNLCSFFYFNFVFIFLIIFWSFCSINFSFQFHSSIKNKIALFFNFDPYSFNCHWILSCNWYSFS